MKLARFVSLAAVCLAACTTVTHFTPGLFRSPHYPYGVRHDGPAAGALLGPEWRLDNFAFDRNGTPKAFKTGPKYQDNRAYDTDADGVTDEVRSEPTYELLFVHDRLDVRIWLDAAVISSVDGNKELQVFADRYVQAASGAGSVLVSFTSGSVGVMSRRFASRTLSTTPCMVSGMPALRLDFEVANVDQMQITDSAIWERGAVVFLRPPYFKRVGKRNKADFPS